MNTRRARLLVVGLGRIGSLHAENLACHVPAGQLAGVVDATEPLARRLGERYGVAWSTSLAGALEDAGVDGVVIAAPTRLHPELVELAASAGKHVLCEKPLGFDVDAGRRAVMAARESGVALQVGFQRRFDPDWRALREALDRGQLGELALLRSSHRNPRAPDASDSLGDVFADVAVHDMDAARWLCGEVAELSALTTLTASSASILLRFESGALGLVDVSRAVGYGFDCAAELVGSVATARIGYGHRPLDVQHLQDGTVSEPLSTDHAERHSPAYVAELQGFAELVLGGPARGATGDDAVAALKLAALAARSASRQGRLSPGHVAMVGDPTE